ncbi:hypothetical protein N3K66_003539 [Trichothecium roseum]|uniref:Uncharacterized protein n=1 Tax=Trichothecium roseum TaxID=47278 RepID=A0ACC0V6E9_9HYPO|nr:hypothetical protein N3K66_003539 [Trichothecium roseum]
MTSVKLYPPSKRDSESPSPLPELLQTPSGLAILELQGTINLPSDGPGGEPARDAQVGRVEFPDYVPGAEGSAWMRSVHMYVGQHQRLTGEVKKLPKALAVVRRRDGGGGGDDELEGEGEEGSLEVVEIVKYKLMFSNRPEPVGTENAT